MRTARTPRNHSESNRAEGALRRSVTVVEVQISSVLDISRPDPTGYTSGLACLRCWMEVCRASNGISAVRNLMRNPQLATGKP